MVESLPVQPAMLVSTINMLLRDDEFDDLSSLCSYYERDEQELIAQLAQEGYAYYADLRQFRLQ